MATTNDLDPTTDEQSAAESQADDGVLSAGRGWASTFGGSSLAVALALAAVLAPAVLVPYAYADDYSLLWMAVGGEPNPQFGRTVFEMAAANGRPLMGWSVQAAFGAAGDIDHLRYVRLIGAIGVVGLALLVQWALMRARVRPWPAAAIALLMCSLPAFQVYGSWAVLFTAPYAAILGGCASLLVTQSAGREGFDRGRLAAAALLLLAGLFFYQPAAMCFWVFLAIAIIESRDDASLAWRVTWLHGAVAAVALGGAYLQTKLAIAYYGDAVPEGSRVRAELSFDVVGRLRWFVEQPLTESLNLFHLGPLPWLAAMVGLAIVVGMAVSAFRFTSRPWLYLGVAVALVPLTYLVNLVTREEQHPYRTQAALSALLALYLGIGAVGLWTVASRSLETRLNDGERRLARVVAWAAGGGLVVASCLFAASNVTNLVATPQMTELRLYRAQVRAIPADATRVSFVQISWYQGIARRFYNDELGVPSTARPFVLVGSFKLLLREQGRLGADRRGPAVDYYPSDVGALPPNQPWIDLRGMSYLK
ncbi:MAG: hypothetical protein K1X87_04750 [Dehalococcoidia bacterium]|nr:hypothetical protein [Dehalococcoidia bacterium]